MTSRMDLLNLIDQTLTEHLGAQKVTRRNDGVLVVAGDSEAFLVQALLVSPPEDTDATTFGEGLVDFINSSGPKVISEKSPAATAGNSDGDVFYTSGNGDQWLLFTDTGGRQFVRHVPNAASGGTVELTDLQSFLDREPPSPQNQALMKVTSRAGGSARSI